MGGKNSYFSNEGKLLKEQRCPPHLIPCLPIGENYLTKEYGELPVRLPTNPYKNHKVVLVGPDYKIKKVLFNKKLNTSFIFNSNTGKQEVWLFTDFIFSKLYNNKIFLGYSCQEGFYIDVFDANGKKLYEISRPYPKRKIPAIIKDTIIKRQITVNKKTQQPMDIKFYEFYPSFCNIELDDDKIYVFLYPDTNSQRVLILDLQGKLLDVSLIPFDVRRLEEYSFNSLLFNYIHNGMKYYLIDNEETEKWELWRVKLGSSIKIEN